MNRSELAWDEIAIARGAVTICLETGLPLETSEKISRAIIEGSLWDIRQKGVIDYEFKPGEGQDTFPWYAYGPKGKIELYSNMFVDRMNRAAEARARLYDECFCY